MTTTAETILQACRAWLKAGAKAGGLTDDQVIPADDDGPRPPIPYLTVKLTTLDLPVGVDEELPALADVLTITGGGDGTSYAVTVNGEAVTYDRADGATDAEAATGLAAAIAEVEHVAAEADAERVIVSARHGTLTTSTADVNLSLDLADEPVLGIGGQRTAGLSVQGFGSVTVDWLERAALRLRSPAIMEALDAAGLSVRAIGATSDLSRLLDTATEGRYLREFEIAYAVRADPVTQIAADLANVSITLERYSDAPDPYTIEASTPVSE